MTTGPLQNTRGLRPGDVVQYSIKLTPRGGQPYWMTRFGAVTEVLTGSIVEVLTLVLHPDPRFEPRTLQLRSPDVSVTFLPPERWPHGVVAIRMRHIMTGKIKLGEA